MTLLKVIRDQTHLSAKVAGEFASDLASSSNSSRTSPATCELAGDSPNSIRSVARLAGELASEPLSLDRRVRRCKEVDNASSMGR